MSSVARTVSDFAARLLPPAQGRHDGYAFCPEDGYWFRPAYTEGKCPLCGELAPSGAPRLPLWLRTDRSWLGLAALALESVGMLALVLFMYFKG